jgi:hypothetical protein
MSTPVLDKVARVVGEGPLLRRVRQAVSRAKERVREIIGR